MIHIDFRPIIILFMTIFLIIGGVIGVIIGCSLPKVPTKEIVYVPIKDTTDYTENAARIIRLEYEIAMYQDSLDMMRQDYGEDLFICKYKLARVAYYNDIAGKNNNIKYLRGWINRVLNE